LKLSAIKPNPDNPRLIKDEKFKKLVQSINDFPKMMELRPIIIDDDNIILGGNMRYRALQELKMKDIPDEWVKKASDLTDEEKKQFIIKDNVGFGEWNYDQLANEWNAEDLDRWGLDIPSFDTEPEQIEAVEDDYEIPDTIKTDIVLGDLFEIGQHRLLCGDSTKIDDVEKLMNGKKADMVFTDPPYGMFLDTDYSGMSGKDRKGKTYDKVIGDNEDFSPELINTIFACFDYCDEIFIWGVDYYFNLIPNFKDGSLIVWDKTLGTNGDADYNSEFELAWSRTPHKKEVIHFNWFRYFGLSSQDIKTREHPTQKPLQIITDLLDKYCKGKIVADIYGGSGSTMVACHQTKRICYMQELDPKYCEVILQRMLKLDPTLEIKRNGEKYNREITGNE
jgi:DNA modification methylase